METWHGRWTAAGHARAGGAGLPGRGRAAADRRRGAGRARRRPGLHHGADRAEPAAREGRADPPAGRAGLRLRGAGRPGGDGCVGDGAADVAAAGLRGGPGRRARPLRGRPAPGGRGASDGAAEGRPEGPGGPAVIVAMTLPLLASVLLGASAARLGRRLPPATAVRLLTAAMLVTALATGFVLTVAGMLVLAQIPLVAALGHYSARALASGLPLPIAAGGLAAGTVCGLLAAALRRAALSGRDLVLAAVACRRLRPAVDGLGVVDDDEPDAYTLPGIGGRVVVSTAMLRALPADERRVLLAHEAAHLSRRHHLWVQAAEVAAAANPLLPPAARAVRAAVERDADEVAATEVGDRTLAARALARAGLARATARRNATMAAAPAGADGGVADRARALLAGPPKRHRALASAVAALPLATVTAATVTSADTEG